jgi:hypothetical protein
MVLLDGDAHARPRSHATVHSTSAGCGPSSKPGQQHAATCGRSPPANVDTALEPLRGHQRSNAITALRALFRFARRRGLIFGDPTRHLRGGRGAERTVLPMTAEQIRAVQQRPPPPPSAWPSPWRPCTPPAPGHPRPLPGRHRPSASSPATPCWPGLTTGVPPGQATADRHVLITRKNALGTGPISATYLADYLGRNHRGISLEHIRRGRILHEALATGADPLHLALVFSIDHTSAMAYAGAGRNPSRRSRGPGSVPWRLVPWQVMLPGRPGWCGHFCCRY